MKDIPLNHQHLRHIAVRKLSIASFFGGLLTLLYGAWIVPWMVAVVLWLIHRIPWWHQAQTFPSLFHFIRTPDLRLGLIWLGYYLLMYAWAAATLSPRQKLNLRAKAPEEYEEKYGAWSLNSYGRYDQAPRMKNAPLSQAWPGELKHQLVEQCYEEYRKALKRYDPALITLKNPPSFLYRKGGKLEWKDSTLILPEEMLVPERIHELLPFLALHLYDYNAEHITRQETQQFPDYIPLIPWLLALTGNFLWLPVTYKHETEEDSIVDSIAQQKQLVLDRDEFAVRLGQGPTLEHQLRRMEEALKKQYQIDDSLPTLIERIGRLSVLNEQERKEMRALGLTPQEPPLVMDPPFGRIGEGKKQKE